MQLLLWCTALFDQGCKGSVALLAHCPIYAEIMDDEHGDEAAASLNPLTKNNVFMEIHPRIKLALNEIGSKPEQEIIEVLVTEIDEHELDVCRQMLFEESRCILNRKLGDGTTTDFELKTRKHPNKTMNYAKDIVKLALFISELKSEYPIDILSKSTTYG